MIGFGYEFMFSLMNAVYWPCCFILPSVSHVCAECMLSMMYCNVFIQVQDNGFCLDLFLLHNPTHDTRMSLLTFYQMERAFRTSMAPPLPGDQATLETVDIVVLVLYFVLVMAVGLWVSMVFN